MQRAGLCDGQADDGVSPTLPDDDAPGAHATALAGNSARSASWSSKLSAIR
jgi:hypothetical protein